MSGLTFRQAYERLKQIYEYLTNNDLIDIDEMIALQKEAEQLYYFCKKEIQKIEDGEESEK